jgi:hypothetical protein
MYFIARSAKDYNFFQRMNYFYSGDEQNNLIAECSLTVVPIKK